VEVSVREAERILSAAGSLVTLAINGDSKPVIVKDILRDPVRGDLMHVDFHAVDLKKELEISVPIRYVGEENRANDGGIVVTLLWEVTVSCLPTQIPEAIEVDVSDSPSMTRSPSPIWNFQKALRLLVNRTKRLSG